MVMPETPYEPLGRVRIVRDKAGNLIGFQDPDRNNRFITKNEALDRLTFDFGSSRIVDSFDNEVGAGGLGMKLGGEDITYKRVAIHWTPTLDQPERIIPGPNQEIVERVVFIDRDGKLIVHETSYGLGERYDTSKYGGRWRNFASQALDLDSSARLPTSELEKAVAYREFIIKTTRNIQLGR